MFIDPAPYNKAFNATDIESGEELQYQQDTASRTALFKRGFIPARLTDNPYLSTQGDYEAMLLSLLNNKEDNYWKAIGILKKATFYRV